MFLNREQANYAIVAAIGYMTFLHSARMTGWQQKAEKAVGLIIMVPGLLLLVRALTR
jgi:hypothetical protein